MTSSPRFQLVPLPYQDSDQRCRTCGKRMVVDPGFGVFGEHQGLIFCLHCDALTPESTWAMVGVERPYRELI
jgi:hypothetical protein